MKGSGDVLAEVAVGSVESAATLDRMRPTYGASFVGRSEDLDALQDLLTKRPLVSVVGEGGVGKTRLATEVAAALQREGHPVAWAELAAVSTRVGVRDALADALPSGPEASTLEELLASRLSGGLLVLDNCEHVLDPVVEVVEATVRACPDLRVLTTTRERLGVAGEVVHRLGPLRLPPPGATPEEAALSPALILLTDRMRDVLGDLAVDESQLPSLLALARVVEGSPLGLELAAARAASIPIGELADLLPGPLRQAAGQHRSRPARHDSLDASVRWSLDLLSAEGRRLLQLLSVFADSFTMATARAVGAGVDDLAPHRVEQVLCELVEASVVRLGSDGRYRLPAAVRFLARDLLAKAGLEDEARDRHAEALYALVTGGGLLLQEEQAVWLPKLDAELPEIRAAMDWHLHRDRPDHAAKILVITMDHWDLRGRHVEFTRRSVDLLAHPGLGDEQRVGVTTTASNQALQAGRLADSYAFAEQALAIPEIHRDYFGRAMAFVYRAWAGFFSGLGNDEQIWADIAESGRIVQQYGWEELARVVDAFRARLTTMARSIPDGTALEAEAVARFAPLTTKSRTSLIFQAWGTALMDLRLDHRAAIAHEALSQAQALGHPTHQVMAMASLGTVAALRGDEKAADRHFQEASAVAAEHDLPTVANLNQRWRAFAHYRFDRDDTAAQAERAVGLARAVGNAWDEAAGLWLLGLAQLRAGDTEAAAQTLAMASESSRDPSYPFSRLRAELGLAVIDLQHDRHRDALDRVHQSITTAADYGDILGLAAALDHLALLESTRFAHDRASRFLGAADALHQTHGVARLPFETRLREQTRDRIVDALGGQAAADGIESGRSLTLDEAIRLARRSRGARKRPPIGWDSLTPAERDVADLAASGLTVPQIAERLFVSPNTVKSHLRRIYTKLGITRRVQLASILTEHTTRA